MMENLVDLQQMAQVKRQQEIDLPPNSNAHDLLIAVYRNSALDLSVRMRAASLAIAYEMPKLMAVAQVTENDLATLLDRRIKRLQEIEAGKLIETKPQPNAVEVKPPMPRLADRRYRRF